MSLLRPALVLILAAAAPISALAASKEQRAHGATVFADTGCNHCHTIRGNGGKKGPNLSGVGRRLSEDQIRTQIMKGGHEMPSFAEILGKSETDDLVAYLRSCRDKGK
jgi:mono/diheme cytochrome c family protein